MEPDILKDMISPNSQEFLPSSLTRPQKLETIGSNNLIEAEQNQFEGSIGEKSNCEAVGQINEGLPGALEPTITSMHLEDFSTHLDQLDAQDQVDSLDSDPNKLGHSVESLLHSEWKCRCSVCNQPMDKNRSHYGGNSCYSCRAFFRRRVQTAGNNKLCSNGGSCNIEEWERKRCVPCRYMACLMAGMRPENVLTEQRKMQRFRQKIAKEGSISMKKSKKLSADEQRKLLCERRKEKYMKKYYLKQSKSDKSQQNPVFAKIEVNIGEGGQVMVRNPYTINQTVADGMKGAESAGISEESSCHGLETIWDEEHQVKLRLPELVRKTPLIDQFLEATTVSGQTRPASSAGFLNPTPHPGNLFDAYESVYTSWLRSYEFQRAIQEPHINTDFTRLGQQILAEDTNLPDTVGIRRSMSPKHQLAASIAPEEQCYYGGRFYFKGISTSPYESGWYPSTIHQGAPIQPFFRPSPVPNLYPSHRYLGNPREQLPTAAGQSLQAADMRMRSKLSVIKFSGRSSSQ